MRYEEFIEQENYWPLQIIQDEYARALDIPLRIFKISLAEELWTQLYHCEAISKKFLNDKAVFHNYLQPIITKPNSNLNQLFADQELWDDCIQKIAGKYSYFWLTTQSSVYPLIESLQENQLWRLWEFFYYYYHLIVDKSSGTRGYLSCSEETQMLHVTFKEFPKEHKLWQECVLVAGPVWEITDTITGYDFEVDRVARLVKCFLDTVKKAGKKCEQEASYLIRMGNHRFPMYSKNIDRQLADILSEWHHLFNMEVPTGMSIHRCDHVRLTEWSLFVSQKIQQVDPPLPQNRSLSQYLEEKKLQFWYRLDHPTSSRSHPWVNTKFGNDNYCFSLSHEINEFKREENKRLLLVDKNNSILSDDEVLTAIRESLSTFLRKLFVRRNARIMESLLLLREWLNDHFGMLKKDADAKSSRQKINAESDERQKKIYRRLCAWVLRRLAADVVTLYSYNHGGQCLEVLSSYVSKRAITYEDQWNKVMPEYMRKAGNNQENRKLSICYRAIDERKVQLTRSYENSETPTSDPPNNHLLSPPKNSGLPSKSSAIAAPILIYDRVWGALEVLGQSPYQFRWENRKFVEELASIFGTFFYLQHFLDGLQALNQIVVSNEPMSKKYAQITEQLANIFLTCAATFWIPAPLEGQYECVYRYNCFTEDYGVRNTLIEESNSEIIRRIAEEKGAYYQNEVSNGWFDKTWCERAAIPDIITHICVIPIYAENKVIASIFLYSKTNSGFNERWIPNITFINEYLALSLQAASAQNAKEKRNQEFVAHEMKQAVKLIEDRVVSLTGYLGNHHIRQRLTEEQYHRIGLWNFDLQNYSKEMVRKMAQFADITSTSDENPVIANAIKIKTTTPDIINFRTLFLNEISSLWQDTRQKNIKFDYENISPKIFIKMHEDNLRQLLRNLLNNAVKYSFKDNEIAARFNGDNYGAIFELTNWGHPLKDEEEDRLFMEDFRGYHAQQLGIIGEGKGLFIVYQICRLYNIGIKYYNSRDNKNFHRFYLSFPPKMIR